MHTNGRHGESSTIQTVAGSAIRMRNGCARDNMRSHNASEQKLKLFGSGCSLNRINLICCLVATTALPSARSILMRCRKRYASPPAADNALDSWQLHAFSSCHYFRCPHARVSSPPTASDTQPTRIKPRLLLKRFGRCTVRGQRVARSPSCDASYLQYKSDVAAFGAEASAPKRPRAHSFRALGFAGFVVHHKACLLYTS